MKIIFALIVYLTLSYGDETTQPNTPGIAEKMLHYKILRLQCLENEGLYYDISESMTYGDLLKLNMSEDRNTCKAICIMQARLDKVVSAPAGPNSTSKCETDGSSYCKRMQCLLEEKFGTSFLQQSIEEFVRSIFKELEKTGAKTVDPKVWQDYKIRDDTLLNSTKATPST